MEDAHTCACTRVCVRGCLCVRAWLGKRNPTEDDVSETTAWNSPYDNGLYLYPYVETVSKAWRDHAPPCSPGVIVRGSLAPLDNDTFCSNTELMNCENFPFGKSYGVIAFGKSYRHNCGTDVTRGLECFFFQNTVCKCIAFSILRLSLLSVDNASFHKRTFIFECGCVEWQK